MNQTTTLMVMACFLVGLPALIQLRSPTPPSDSASTDSAAQQIARKTSVSDGARAMPLAPGEVVVATGHPRRGAEKPLVTIVHFSEFECASCQRMARALKGLVSKYPEDVAVIWKDLPSSALKPRSLIAAKFARAVYEYRGNEAFWKLHDELFIDLSKLRESHFVALGKTINFDVRAMMTGSLESVQASIEQSVEEAESLGLVVTPSILINGKKVVVSETELFSLVEKLRTEALQLEKTGVPRDVIAAKLAVAP